MYLLFPGRHHLLTNFQLEYLTRVTSGDPRQLRDIAGEPFTADQRIDTILWAITSANHAHTRRNPLPAHRREVAIEDFAEQLDARSYVFLIDDLGSTPRFAEYLIKKIDVDSQGRFRLTPANTVIGCSTPEVIAMYERLGFRILPVELVNRSPLQLLDMTPWQLLDHLVEVGRRGGDWQTDELYLTKVARATRRLYQKYHYGDLIVALHQSPLLTDDGDLTDTRDYNTYVRAFDAGAQRKYELIKDHVVPGRIVDIGCCTGALLRELSYDDRLRESDFFGVEVARPLYVECLHRKEQRDFGSDHVFFYQQDFASGPVFADHSVSTFTTFSLTHEIESYGGRAALLRFLQLLYAQTALGGRWLNVDVVGPEQGEREVYLWLEPSDGRSDDWEREFEPAERIQLRDYLDGLSTYARFLRFARDFRREEGERLAYREMSLAGVPYVVLALSDACEFLSKKDYTDNWMSEMHERFCFWSFAQWSEAAREAGFQVASASHAFTNPWIVENRWRDRAVLYQRCGTELQPLPYPVTNMLLIADKLA